MRGGLSITPADGAPLLVTGASGVLGGALLDSSQFATAVATSRRGAPGGDPALAVDLRDRDAARRLLDTVVPHAVIHTVALTDVDRCERAAADAYSTSVLTTLNIAEWIRERAPATQLVYISTDQVYSGPGPHREEDVAPVNAYGATKHAGELAARVAPSALVLRTNFYGRSVGARPSFSDWIARAVEARERVVLDERAWFSALHLADLVALVSACLTRELTGTFNLASSDGIAKVEFARRVAALSAGDPELVEGKALDQPERAPRPLDLRLDVARIESALGRRMPTIDEGLTRLADERAVIASDA